MKKYFLIMFALSFIVISAHADEFIDYAIDMAKKMLPIYSKLETCTIVNSEYFQIFGIENNKCHFKYVNYDCYAPIEITRKVARNSQKAALDTIYNGNFSTHATTPEAKYNEAFYNNKMYCSTKY